MQTIRYFFATTALILSSVLVTANVSANFDPHRGQFFNPLENARTDSAAAVDIGSRRVAWVVDGKVQPGNTWPIMEEHDSVRAGSSSDSESDSVSRQ